MMASDLIAEYAIRYPSVKWMNDYLMLKDTSSDYKLSLLTIVWKWMEYQHQWTNETMIDRILHLAKDEDRSVRINALDLLASLFIKRTYSDMMSDQDWFQKLHRMVASTETSVTQLLLWFILAYLHDQQHTCSHCMMHLAIELLSLPISEHHECRFVTSERILLEKVR
jgi:hypothetical protein